MPKRKRRSYKDNDGNKLPSVTELLGGLGWKYQPLLHWANKLGRQGLTLNEGGREARDIGTCAHDLIEAFVCGQSQPKREKQPTEVWEGAQVALESFKRFWEREGMASRVEVLGAETMMVDVEQGWGGTADLICLLDGKATILDYKTGKRIYAETAIQLEAYAHLWAVDGCGHDVDADEIPLPPSMIEKRKRWWAIEQTGIIHCPADGRETQIVLIPVETRGASQHIWKSLLEMQRHRKSFDAFASELKKLESVEETTDDEKAPF